jgi:hypothetical protein
MFYVWMDVDAIICLLCVQMWGREAERWSWLERQAHQGPMRPPRGESTGGRETSEG